MTVAELFLCLLQVITSRWIVVVVGGGAVVAVVVTFGITAVVFYFHIWPLIPATDYSFNSLLNCKHLCVCVLIMTLVKIVGLLYLSFSLSTKVIVSELFSLCVLLLHHYIIDNVPIVKPSTGDTEACSLNC